MANEAQKAGIWTQLSKAFSGAIETVQESIVAIHSGGRSTSSGVVWRPGIVITTHHGLRHREGIKVNHAGNLLDASLIDGDPATDLAVLRISMENLRPVESTNNGTYTGEVILSVGRSRLGDISASYGIVARTGDAWRTWRGGQIDRLIRPDIQLYVGQSGSALVNEQRQVLGINSPALARQAVITIPTQTIDRIIDAVLERGHVPRPFLGIAMQAVPIPEPARSLFPAEAEHALLVMHVEPKAPAALAGVMVGDLIVSANGDAIGNVRDFLHWLSGLHIGDSISLVVIRGGAKVDLTVSVADRNQP
ncbi:MAG: trypsin-like peptidase domain-containing protein [Silvibacterium sp.]|jgi:S1-C subfamily serine protease